jgi:hypothetical protein
MKQIKIELTNALHKKLKMISAKREVTMKRFVLFAIKKQLGVRKDGNI